MAEFMNIKTLKESQRLVSIYRDKIDGNQIQGFILGYSEKLILIQYVYDFNLDGLMILRRKDISEISSSKTDLFQTELLKTEDLYSKVNFDISYPLESWAEFLAAANKTHTYFVLEAELKKHPEFVIGKISRLGKNKVEIKSFTGIARWEDDPKKLKYKDISSCQIKNNYANVYERYFERLNK